MATRTRLSSGRAILSVIALSMSVAASADIYVVTYHNTNAIMRYSDTGTFREVFIPRNTGGLSGAQSMVFGGPDVEWFIADGSRTSVMIFDTLTGKFRREIQNNAFGQMYGITFGPDQMIYATADGNQVHKINPTTGHYFGTFNVGGALGVSRGIVLSPNGYFLVGDNWTDEVKKYDSTTGFYLGLAAGGVDGPDGIAILPNGNIAVCGYYSQNITEHNPANGQFVRVLVWQGSAGLIRPRHVLRMLNDELLVCDTDGQLMLKYDSSTGMPTGIFAGGGFLSSPVFAAYGPTLTFAPAENLTILAGRHIGGGLAQILESDETRLVMRPGPVFSTSQSPVRIQVEGTAPVGATRLRIDIESAATSSSIAERVEMLNVTTGLYDHIATRQMTTSDSQVRHEIPNAQNYIDPATRKIVARILCRATGPVFTYPWETRFDQIRWTSQ